MSLEDKLLFRRRKWINCDRFSTMECGHFRPPVKLIRSVPWAAASFWSGLETQMEAPEQKPGLWYVATLMPMYLLVSLTRPRQRPPGLAEDVFWAFQHACLGADGTPMLLQRFCKAFHKNDFFGLNFPLTLFVCWVVTKTLGYSCTNHVMVNSMPQRDGTWKQHVAWKTWDGCLILWIHACGCCMNQPKAMQFQLYAASLLSMLTTCLVLVTQHHQPTWLLKLPWNKLSSFAHPFAYCGAKMTRDEDGTWHISHKEYLSKVSPLPIGKDRQPHQPMSEKEHTMLRQLLGSLQWPAVQTSPHLQASTSLLSGEMSTGLSSPLIEVNKLLRFAKSNSDVHLRFPPLGRLED